MKLAIISDPHGSFDDLTEGGENSPSSKRLGA